MRRWYKATDNGAPSSSSTSTLASAAAAVVCSVAACPADVPLASTAPTAAVAPAHAARGDGLCNNNSTNNSDDSINDNTRPATVAATATAVALAALPMEAIAAASSIISLHDTINTTVTHSTRNNNTTSIHHTDYQNSINDTAFLAEVGSGAISGIANKNDSSNTNKTNSSGPYTSARLLGDTANIDINSINANGKATILMTAMAMADNGGAVPQSFPQRLGDHHQSLHHRGDGGGGGGGYDKERSTHIASPHLMPPHGVLPRRSPYARRSTHQPPQAPAPAPIASLRVLRRFSSSLSIFPSLRRLFSPPQSYCPLPLPLSSLRCRSAAAVVLWMALSLAMLFALLILSSTFTSLDANDGGAGGGGSLRSPHGSDMYNHTYAPARTYTAPPPHDGSVAGVGGEAVVGTAAAVAALPSSLGPRHVEGGGKPSPAGAMGATGGDDEEEAEEASFSSIMDAVSMNLTASAELLMGAFEEGGNTLNMLNTSTTASLPVLDTAARVMLLSRREVALGGASPLPPLVLPLWRAVGYALVRSMMAKYEASRARYEGGRMGSPTAVPPPSSSRSVDTDTDDDSPFVPWLHGPLQCHNTANGGPVCFRHVRHLAPSFGSEGYLPPSPIMAPYLSEHECLALCAGHEHCAGAVCTAVGGQANATSTRSYSMMGTCRLVDGRLLQAYGAGGATDASFAARLGGVGPFTASDVPMGGGGGRGRKSLRVHLSTAAMHMLGMGGGGGRGGVGGSLRAAQLRANSSRPFAPDRFQEGRAALHHYMLFCMLGTAGSIPRRVLPSLATWLYPYKALLFLDDEGAAVSGAIKAVLGPFLSASSGAPPPLKEGGAAAAADGVGHTPSSPTDIKSPLLSLDVRRHWSSTQQGGWPGSLSDLYSSARGGGQQQGFKRCVFLRPPQAAAPAQHRKGDRPPLPPLAQQQGGVMRRRAISAKGIGGAWKNGQIVRYLALLPPQHRFPWYAIVDDDTHYIDWNFRALFSSVMGMGGGGGEHSDDGDGDAEYAPRVAANPPAPPHQERLLELWREINSPGYSSRGPSRRPSSPPHRSNRGHANRTCTDVESNASFPSFVFARQQHPIQMGFFKLWGTRERHVPMIHGGGGLVMNQNTVALLSAPSVSAYCYGGGGGGGGGGSVGGGSSLHAPLSRSASPPCSWGFALHGDVRMGCCASALDGLILDVAKGLRQGGNAAVARGGGGEVRPRLANEEEALKRSAFRDLMERWRNLHQHRDRRFTELNTAEVPPATGALFSVANFSSFSSIDSQNSSVPSLLVFSAPSPLLPNVPLLRFPIQALAGSAHETPSFMNRRYHGHSAFPTSFHRIDDSVDFAAFVDVATERARAFEERMRREDEAANANPDGGGDSSYYFPFIGYRWIREVYEGV